MGEETVRAVLNFVAEEWRELRADRWAHRRAYGSVRLSSLQHERWDPLEDEAWPWGVWIKLHQPVDGAEDPSTPATPVRRAWFLNEDGLREMSAWSLLRFWTVQFERPWDARFVSHAPDAAFARPRWRIGYASFAEYLDSDELYLETVWGGLWARGKRAQVTGDAVRVVRELWVS